MPKLVIDNWSNHRRWICDKGWSLNAYCYRIGLCTGLQGTELESVAKSVKYKEIREIAGVNLEYAEPLINILESVGAKVVIEN